MHSAHKPHHRPDDLDEEPGQLPVNPDEGPVLPVIPDASDPDEGVEPRV